MFGTAHARRAAALAMAVLALAAPGWAAAASEQDKLDAEVAKLQAETQKAEGDNEWYARAPAYGAVFAAIVALLGVYMTLRQQLNDRRKDKEDSAAQRERELTQRFDEQFTQIVSNLTSQSKDVRASAAASIRAFLKPEHKRFHEQVVALLSANLKFPRDDLTDRIIGITYAEALQEHRDNLKELCGPAGPDLLEATLMRANLSNLNLEGCEMYHANLHGSDFSGARLVKANARYADLSSAVFIRADLEAAYMRSANLQRARLQGARLVSTKLDGAKAQNAAFDGALLQEANFDKADMRAATFRGADVNNAFFRGTQFDEPALRSMLEAHNWLKANLDPETLERLKDMAKAKAKPDADA